MSVCRNPTKGSISNALMFNTVIINIECKLIFQIFLLSCTPHQRPHAQLTRNQSVDKTFVPCNCRKFYPWTQRNSERDTFFRIYSGSAVRGPSLFNPYFHHDVRPFSALPACRSIYCEQWMHAFREYTAFSEHSNRYSNIVSGHRLTRRLWKQYTHAVHHARRRCLAELGGIPPGRRTRPAFLKTGTRRMVSTENHCSRRRLVR